MGINTRSFIPAHTRRTSHNTVRDLVFSINNSVVVVVINGFEKTLQYKDCLGHTKTLALTSEDEEVCETIARLVLQHNLQNRPLVITGLLCVGMGQTLTHRSLGSFTSAIFGHLDLTNDEIYQLFGRITGRMKEWGDKYIQTQVYCPTSTMNRCIVMEECARNMACEHNGEVVSQKDYRAPMNVMGEAGQSAIENIRIPKKKQQAKKKNVIAEIVSRFYACDRANFDKVKTEFFINNVDHVNDESFNRNRNHKFQNPFIESQKRDMFKDAGRYEGQLHGRWEVFDFNTQKNSEEGWRWDISLKSKPRLTICYNGDLLGVAVRYSTGKTV